MCYLPKYYYGDQIKEVEMNRTCCTHGRDKNAHKIAVGILEWRRPHGKPRRR
jgi:hypothetical protein